MLGDGSMTITDGPVSVNTVINMPAVSVVIQDPLFESPVHKALGQSVVVAGVVLSIWRDASTSVIRNAW